MADKLNDRQKRFADEYIIDLNATQAAIRAGYSEKTADVQGARLLGNVKVQEHVQLRRKSREERTKITQDRVLNELASVGFAKAADYTDASLKFSNKLRALELLGKHLGLFEGGTAKTEADNNLFEAIKDCAKGDYDEISELQQETEANDDLVGESFV